METSVLQQSVYTQLNHIKKFIKQFYKKGSLGPVKSEFERGYYTCLIHQVQESPQMWLLLDDETRAALDDVKKNIDSHFGLIDTGWPPNKIKVHT